MTGTDSALASLTDEELSEMFSNGKTVQDMYAASAEVFCAYYNIGSYKGQTNVCNYWDKKSPGIIQRIFIAL